MTRKRIVEYHMLLICADRFSGNVELSVRVMNWCLSRPGLWRAFYKRRNVAMHLAKFQDIHEMAWQFDAEVESKKALKAVNSMLERESQSTDLQKGVACD